MEAGEKDTKSRIEDIDFEKRRYLRFDIHLPIEYDQIKSSITHTGNISESGLLIYFPEETNVSQYLRLKLFFSLGSELNTIKVLAEVVWMDNHLSKDREYYPYGVKFIDISPEDGTKLRNFLRSLSLPLEDESRIELRRMSRRALFKLALNQRMSNCLIGGRPCSFYLQYKGSSFCVSEILGKECEVERLEQLKQLYDEKEEANSSLPFLQKMETELLSPGRKAVEFKVYYRDPLTRSTVFLGKIIERRRKERGDNLKGLLNKAIKQYSDQVVDPSTMFLLEG
jgi:hypothetical protein